MQISWRQVGWVGRWTLCRRWPVRLARPVCRHWCLICWVGHQRWQSTQQMSLVQQTPALMAQVGWSLHHRRLCQLSQSRLAMTSRRRLRCHRQRIGLRRDNSESPSSTTCRHWPAAKLRVDLCLTLGKSGLWKLPVIFYSTHATFLT